MVRVRAGLTGLVALALAAVGCTSDSDGGDRAGDAATATTAHHAAAQPALAADATPREVRARYEQLLGQHALLAMRLARSEVAKDAELQKVVEGSLAANADALQQLVGVTYDGAQATEFEQLWQGYRDELAAYADAAAAGNTTGAEEARAALLAHCDDWGAWLADASGGRVQAAQATGSAQARVGRLMDQIDAYADRDYGQAYKLERQAYEHMFAAGTALAKAGLEPKEAAALDAPAGQLRAAFAMLLGEHMQLIIDTQRATFDGAPQFKAAAAQVNANTEALTKGMGAIVGPKKAEEFQSAWAEHVEGLLEYSTAVAGNDPAEKTAAREEMRGYGARLALYLSDIVRNELPLEPLTAALGEHDQHLVDQIDAYAAKRYDEAQEMELEGYEQMLGVADTILGALQKTVKPGLPVGGSQTGGGGTASRTR